MIRLILIPLLSLLLLAGCGDKKEDHVETGADYTSSHNSSILNKIFSESKENVERVQIDENEIELLSLSDVVERSLNDAESESLRAALIKKVKKALAEKNEVKLCEWAVAASLSGDSSLKEQLIAHIESASELSVSDLYQVADVLSKDAEVIAAIEGKQDYVKATIDAHLEAFKTNTEYKSNKFSVFEVARICEDLVLGSLLLGKENYAEHYHQGSEFLLLTLNRIGRFGEMKEGLENAQKAIEALVSVTRATALNEDETAFTHESWLHVSDWLIHFLLPGRYVVNYGYSRGMSVQEREGANSRFAQSLAELVLLRQDPIALWGLKRLFDGLPVSVAGLGAHLFIGIETNFEPLPYGFFPQAGTLVWRNNWGDHSFGLWLKGGTLSETMSHQDYGHFSFYIKGRPILIEGGMPLFGSEEDDAEFASYRAHNVLAIDGDAPLTESAPIIVRLLDENRGNVRIDATKCYSQLSRWNRDIFWKTNGEVRVVDELSYKIGQRGRSSFRWHLGVKKPVEFSRSKNRYIAEADGFAIVIQGNEAIEVSQTIATNYAFDNEHGSTHTVLMVKTIGRPTDLKIMTRIIPTDSKN